MTDTTRNRLAIDLDEIERQLVQPAPVAGRQDPLAELARIVGQDDPFRAILADRPAPVAPERRASFDDYLDSAQAAPRAAHAPAQRLTAEEEHLLGLTPQAQAYDAHGYAADQMHDEPAPEMPAYVAEKPRRRGLIVAGSVMGVAVVGLTTAFMMKGSGGSARTGEVPVVRADAGPTKIQPQNPGGIR